MDVAGDQDKSDTPQPNVDAMIDEFRAARQRRLVRRGVTPPASAEREPDPAGDEEPPPPDEDEDVS